MQTSLNQLNNLHTFKRIQLFSLLLFTLITMVCCDLAQIRLDKTICNDSIQYWDLESVKNKKNNPKVGFGFTRRGTILYYEILENRYRLLSDDCISVDDIGCSRWSTSMDSILSIYMVGSPHILKMKVIKYNSDTIVCNILGSNKLNVYTRVKELKSIIRKGDPRRKQILRGRFNEVVM